MSGGSQHNPNGRQSQLGSGWSPLQLQVANFLSRAPQAHMASERGVTWHTPTPPPPHLYHVPVPSPPDPLQAMKGAGSNSVFRHTATPPDLYRHTPTPPDTKHLLRHTPSPGDVKSAATIPPTELYPHLLPSRDKLPRPEELLYGRGAGGGGVDLSLGGRSSNGAPSPALSVRDAPTINSLIARAQPRHPHAKFDAILERLVPSPVSPHSVIVHSRAAPTPSPPSSNEDSTDSCGAPPGSKRKRKPDRTIRMPSAPGTPNPPTTPTPPTSLPNISPVPAPDPLIVSRVTPAPEPIPVENGETSHEEQNGPEPEKTPEPPEPHARRKTRSGSAETIDDIAAMIASQKKEDLETPEYMPEKIEGETESDTPVTIDKLKSVLASPEPSKPEIEIKMTPPKIEEMEKQIESPVVEAATAPKRRRSPRNSNSESTNVPVESPSEAKPAEPEACEEPTTEPVAASFVEVENQLEKMFAGIEEEVPPVNNNIGSNEIPVNENPQANKTKKRRKSVVAKAERKPSRRSSRASTSEEPPKKKPGRKKSDSGIIKKVTKEASGKDAYDSGSNASSSRSRGPYVQIRGPGDSPLSVSVINATTGDEETDGAVRRKGEDFRNGLRARGLHASTLGLRYDATTPDATWLCAFCERGPHAHGLGDLFGPYTIHADCEEYRALDEATRHRYESKPSYSEVWFHEACAVWAPGLVAAGARLWGLDSAVWAARGARCGTCGRPGAGLACAERTCKARSHFPCGRTAHWTLKEEEYRATCPRHA